MSGASTSSPRAKSRWPLRLALVVLALVLSCAAFLHRDSRQRTGAALARDVASTGVGQRHPKLAVDLEREPSSAAARLLLARALLADELDPRWVARLPADERQAERKHSIARLDLARRAAAKVLTQQPASWEAAMILGGARYLEGRRKDDAEIYYDKKPWLAPLEAAERLGPGQIEPLQLRAATTLDTWFSLTPEGRKSAEDLLRRAFEDPKTFDLLAPSWLAIAPNKEIAYSLVPPRAGAWLLIEEIYARARDWDQYEAARRRWFGVLHGELQRELANGERQLAEGEGELARVTLMTVVREAPPDQRFAAIVNRALEEAPAALANSADAKAFKGWLDWTLDQCQIRACPLSSTVIGRLAAGIDDLPLAESALAALAADDLPRAERLERRAQSVWGVGWNTYWIFKAETAAREGDVATARTALEQVDPSLRDFPTYRRATLAVGRADHQASSPATALSDVAASAWSPFDWRFKDGKPRLTLVPDRAASSIEVSIAKAPPTGTLVALIWDGEEMEAKPAFAGKVLTLSTAVDPYQIHRLEIRRLSGGKVVPGAVRIAGS